MSEMLETGRRIEMPIPAELAAHFLNGQIQGVPNRRPLKRIFFGEVDASGVGDPDGVPLGEHWQLMAVRTERTDTGEMVFGTFREVWP